MDRQPKKRAKISWEGDSLEVLSGFPDDVKKDLGFGLHRLQVGEVPVHSRPMQSIGPGVFELKEADSRTWYRVIYLSKIEDTIYILHSFEKNSRKTDKRDLETAKARLKEVRKRLQEAKSEKKS